MRGPIVADTFFEILVFFQKLVKIELRHPSQTVQFATHEDETQQKDTKPIEKASQMIATATPAELVAPDLTKYNGVLGVTSTRTGDHRVFRIHSVKFGQGDDAALRRVVQISCGYEEWQSFGFVTRDGFIQVWRRYQSATEFTVGRVTKTNPTMWERFATMLEQIAKLERDGKVTLTFDAVCRRCSRPLTDPESVKLGLGPVCRQEWDEC